MGDDFAAVLDAAQRGDEGAVATLWRSLNPRVVRFLRGQAGEAAEDLASETWLTVARHLRQFRGGEGEFRAWLFTIARTRLVDWQRRNQRRPQVTDGLERVRTRAAGDDPAGEALDELATRDALRVVAQLPRAQAEVILLRVVADLDVAEVARILGRRPGNVRMLQHRGLERLRAVLAGTGHDSEAVTR